MDSGLCGFGFLNLNTHFPQKIKDVVSSKTYWKHMEYLNLIAKPLVLNLLITKPVIKPTQCMARSTEQWVGSAMGAAPVAGYCGEDIWQW